MDISWFFFVSFLLMIVVFVMMRCYNVDAYHGGLDFYFGFIHDGYLLNGDTDSHHSPCRTLF